MARVVAGEVGVVLAGLAHLLGWLGRLMPLSPLVGWPLVVRHAAAHRLLATADAAAGPGVVALWVRPGVLARLVGAATLLALDHDETEEVGGG